MDLTRQFMSINQDIVAWSQKEKWGLGRVILGQSKKRKKQFAEPVLSERSESNGSNCGEWIGLRNLTRSA
jgi:hypothetical protein